MHRKRLDKADSISETSRHGNRFEKPNSVPRVVQDPHACFLAPFLFFQVSPLGDFPTASSSAKLIFADNLDSKALPSSIALEALSPISGWYTQ